MKAAIFPDKGIIIEGGKISIHLSLVIRGEIPHMKIGILRLIIKIIVINFISQNSTG